MTHPAYIREKARQLRIERGLTIDEIAERLAISRTTIYHWLRDLPPLKRSGFAATSGQKLGSERMQAKYRALRRAAYEQGLGEFNQLALEPTFRDFVCMYIGEGYKRSRNTVSIANSDATVIRLATYWIRSFSQNPVTYAIQYHADQDLDDLRTFWRRILGDANADIRFQRKSNSGQLNGRTWRSRHGVLTVSANDTAFRARLQAWIDCVQWSWLELEASGA